MKQLPDKLSGEQVEELARAGRVEYESFCGNNKFFAVIDGNLYRKKNSYHLLKTNYHEYKESLKKIKF